MRTLGGAGLGALLGDEHHAAVLLVFSRVLLALHSLISVVVVFVVVVIVVVDVAVVVVG